MRCASTTACDTPALAPAPRTITTWRRSMDVDQVADQRRQSAFRPWSSVHPQGQHIVLQRVRQHEASSPLRPPRIVHLYEYPAQDAQGSVPCPDPPPCAVRSLKKGRLPQHTWPNRGNLQPANPLKAKAT